MYALNSDPHTYSYAFVDVVSALNGATPEQVVELLLKIAVNSDNTYNPIDDSYYVCTILTALARIRLSSHSPAAERQMSDIIDVVRPL